VKAPPYRRVLVVGPGAMVSVGYGTIFYPFGVMLGEGAGSRDK
jgi:hypothetical protein